jgi:hypothetical protein
MSSLCFTDLDLEVMGTNNSLPNILSYMIYTTLNSIFFSPFQKLQLYDQSSRYPQVAENSLLKEGIISRLLWTPSITITSILAAIPYNIAKSFYLSNRKPLKKSMGFSPEKYKSESWNEAVRNEFKEIIPLTIATIIAQPLEVMRIKFALEASETPQYSGIFDSLRILTRNDGFLGLYSSLPAQLLFLFITRMRERVARRIRGNEGDLPKDRRIWLLLGLIILAYPFSTIVNRLTGQIGLEKKYYTGIVDCAMKIWQDEGVQGFFKGFLWQVGIDFLESFTVMFCGGLINLKKDIR